MKILYIGTTDAPDFMSDTIFHGFRTLLGTDVVDGVKIPQLYTDYSRDLNSVHGRGFTIAKTLTDEGIDREDIEEKIISNYFDYVIYGASHRDDGRHYIQLVAEHYSPRRIVFINGADSWRGTIQPEKINLPGIHFMRERLTNDKSHPLSFSIPKEIIVNEVPTKEYYLMPLVPGVASTYIYNDQEAYYNMYQKSLFGLTWKKAGWDCLRHYEILSQGCLPLFLDIHHLPLTLMNMYPRVQVEELLTLAVSIEGYKKDMEFTYDDRITLSNVDLSKIEFKNPEEYGYYEIANKLLSYTKNYLTTEYQAGYILNTLKLYT
jgi:hypothetical protein